MKSLIILAMLSTLSIVFAHDRSRNAQYADDNEKQSHFSHTNDQYKLLMEERRISMVHGMKGSNPDTQSHSYSTSRDHPLLQTGGIQKMPLPSTTLVNTTGSLNFGAVVNHTVQSSSDSAVQTSPNTSTFQHVGVTQGHDKIGNVWCLALPNSIGRSIDQITMICSSIAGKWSMPGNTSTLTGYFDSLEAVVQIIVTSLSILYSLWILRTRTINSHIK